MLRRPRPRSSGRNIRAPIAARNDGKAPTFGRALNSVPHSDSNLARTREMATNRLVSASTNLVDANFSGNPARFYRASNWR